MRDDRENHTRDMRESRGGKRDMRENRRGKWDKWINHKEGRKGQRNRVLGKNEREKYAMGKKEGKLFRGSGLSREGTGRNLFAGVEAGTCLLAGDGICLCFFYGKESGKSRAGKQFSPLAWSEGRCVGGRRGEGLSSKATVLRLSS